MSCWRCALFILHLTRVGRSFWSIFADIFKSIKGLPKPIRRVCFVQLFAWMGWYVASATVHHNC